MRRSSILAATAAAVTLACALAAPGRAIAQPSLTPLADPPAEQAAPEPEKSESVSLLLAAGSTALGYGLALSSQDGPVGHAAGWAGLGLVLVGPSAGHIYSGEGWHAARMTALRAGGLLVFTMGLFSNTTSADCIDACPAQDHTGGKVAMVLGASAFLGATIYDLVDAPRAARRASAPIAVLPTVLPTAGGAAPGLVLGGTF